MQNVFWRPKHTAIYERKNHIKKRPFLMTTSGDLHNNNRNILSRTVVLMSSVQMEIGT